MAAGKDVRGDRRAAEAGRIVTGEERGMAELAGGRYLLQRPLWVDLLGSAELFLEKLRLQFDGGRMPAYQGGECSVSNSAGQMPSLLEHSTRINCSSFFIQNNYRGSYLSGIANRILIRS